MKMAWVMVCLFGVVAVVGCLGRPDSGVASPALEETELGRDAGRPLATRASGDTYQDANTRGWAPWGFGVYSGDSMTWHFASPSPGNALVRGVPNPTTHFMEIAPYEPSLTNEIVGPLILAPSGVFTLGPTSAPLVSQSSPCPVVDGLSTFVASRPPAPAVPSEYLCRDTDPAHIGRTMDSTWNSPELTGVFIRLQWKHLQPEKTTWADGILEREADAAAEHGKLFSVVIESGRDGQPPWLVEPLASGGAGLPAIELIWNDGLDVNGHCDDTFAYADPTSDEYRALYEAALTHVAEVLKRKSSRYRALSYIKPSGANRTTGENRLPSRCRPGCAICNTKAWAEAGYKPSRLYAFYEHQIAHIAAQFPGKSMSYMSMPGGFPRVGEWGCWVNETGATRCPPNVTNPNHMTVPGGEEQTNTIIANALTSPATSALGAFVVEFQGLDTRPESVNQQVERAGATGRPTMYQTSNAGQVGAPAQINDTFQVLWDHSAASALEIYEERLWQANGLPLGSDVVGNPNATRTIGEWNALLHDRRRANYAALGDPTPATFTFVFGTPVITPPSGVETNRYLDPRVALELQYPSCNNDLCTEVSIYPGLRPAP